MITRWYKNEDVSVGGGTGEVRRYRSSVDGSLNIFLCTLDETTTNSRSIGTTLLRPSIPGGR